jgi:hypothetical protein
VRKLWNVQGQCITVSNFVKSGDNEVTDFVDQRKGVRQGCSSSP